jgi:hypothetical protein
MANKQAINDIGRRLNEAVFKKHFGVSIHEIDSPNLDPKVRSRIHHFATIDYNIAMATEDRRAYMYFCACVMTREVRHKRGLDVVATNENVLPIGKAA